ncbi:MAG: hypothetical protein II998_05585 [Clostridia bacterium]|nr:hypothetical protein [Clostridia bacterium]
MKNVTIPVALQIIADDYGWHNGRDGRLENRPSRSGLPRDHAVEDYIIMNEIGKALDMKILTPFVIGEWDKDNILRNVKNVTYNEQGWDRASEIDMRMAEKCFDAAENSEYVEYAYHGLMHGYYVDNQQICETEYSRPRYDEKTGKYDMTTFDYIPESEMQEYIDLFFRIYDSWGFKKKIRSFVSPCSIHTPPELTGDFANVLKKNGFIHWANYWGLLGDSTAVINGVTFMQKSFIGAHWDQYDIDPITLFDQTKTSVGDKEYTNPAMGFHWTNFLRLAPENNLKNIDEWIKYFRRQGKIFGQMLSRDVAFAASQAVYSRYGKLSSEGKKYTVDLTDVDSKGSLALRDEFFVSTKAAANVRSCVGGKMSLYEIQPWHKTYKIERINKAQTISFELA